MKTKLAVLVIEDSELDAKILLHLLQAGGFEVHSIRVETPDDLRAAIRNGSWDLILADYNLPLLKGPEALRLVQESGNDIPFIVISGGIGEDLAVQIMKAGAHDYLMKGALARLVPVVEREVRESRDRQARRTAEAGLRAADEQFRIAREIQQRLFPKSPPQIDGFDIAGASFPAQATGGDYFDFIPMSAGTWGLTVGDVTGHGIGPALLMSETRAYLRLLARYGDEVGDILARANTVLSEDLGDERYVTLLLVKLDPATRRLYYANAGHPPGFVIDRHGGLRLELRRTGMPLGLCPDVSYTPAAPVELSSGETVILVSDGFEEAMSPQQEMFGRERLIECISTNHRASAREILARIHDAVEAHVGGGEQQDDYTTVVLKVL
ncbi:MAG: response regulator [Pedosphaera sp.]|nr:response regulator [Pedosphaera sp.]